MSTSLEQLAADPDVKAALAKIPRVATARIQHPTQPELLRPYPAVRRGRVVRLDGRNIRVDHLTQRVTMLERRHATFEIKAAEMKEEIVFLRKALEEIQ